MHSTKNVFPPHFKMSIPHKLKNKMNRGPSETHSARNIVAQFPGMSTPQKYRIEKTKNPSPSEIDSDGPTTRPELLINAIMKR